MPEDLLAELETAPNVAGSLENIEHLLPVVIREVDWAMKGMKGSALTFENAWGRIVKEVAQGHTDEIQTARARLLSAFEKRLGLLKETHILATWLRKLGRDDVPDPETLAPEIARLEKLKTSVFDRWQTADDLEELAARDFPLTTADLERIGPNRRPPESWYAEESKPF